MNPQPSDALLQLSPRPRSFIAIWVTAAVMLVVGAVFAWMHLEAEQAVRKVGASNQAVAEARNSLSDAFLQLALHESDSDPVYVARAKKEFGEVSTDIGVAINSFDQTNGPANFRADLIAFRQAIDRERATERRSRADRELAIDAQVLVDQANRLHGVAQAQWLDAGQRLDAVFVRSMAGVTVLSILLISVVFVTTWEHSRSVEACEIAEATAYRQAHLLSAIAEGTTEAVFMKDRAGRYLYANRATAVFVGKPVHEIVGSDDRILFDRESAVWLMARDRELMENARTETSEETLTAAGSTRTYLVTKGPVCDQRGEVIGLIGISCDITRQKADGQALRDSEARYRRVLELLPEAVFLNDNDRVAYCNPAYVALRGAASADDIIGTSVFDMFPPEDHARVRERIAICRTPAATTRPEMRRLVRMDGRTLSVEVTGLPLSDDPDAPHLVVLHDITGERRADAWAKSILDHTLDSIISTDRVGVITSFNAAAESQLGYRADEVIGQPIQLVFPDARRRDVGRRQELRARQKDGSIMPLDVAVSEFDLEGERHVIAVGRDMSERRRLEADLRQAHKMEALGQVAGGVAHDFNNLLTVILGYSDMLQDQFLEGDPRWQFASDIRRATGRAADLTRQLLTFSRRTVVAPKVIDANAVVKDMNRMLRRVLGEDIELSVVAAEAVRPIFIDPGSLEQIVMNLCVNARDAMPTGGRITIATGCGNGLTGTDATGKVMTPGHYVTLTVSDTGDGIPDAVRAHIFEPFFTTKGIGKGTGLGLAVVSGLVEQNGGYILLNTAPQRGTSFTIVLPAVSEPLSAVADTPERAPRGAGETILLVEDEEPVRRLAAIALASSGYRVLDAPDGRAAVELFDRHHATIDLVVTDVVMPHLGGRELAQALAQRRPSLRVIFTSGYADDAVLRHGISRSEVPFLPKPYTPSGLLQKVREVIDQTRAPSPQRPA